MPLLADFRQRWNASDSDLARLEALLRVANELTYGVDVTAVMLETALDTDPEAVPKSLALAAMLTISAALERIDEQDATLAAIGTAASDYELLTMPAAGTA